MVFVTEHCRGDARAHGLVNELDAFKERVEQTQSTSLFDPFPPPYLVKKKIGGRQGRLIAERRARGEHVVIVFLAILIRGHHEYESGFARDPVDYGKRHFSDLASDEQLGHFVDERTRIAPPQSKPVPSDAEYAFLFDWFSHHKPIAGGDFVCETQVWVDHVTGDRFANQLALFAGACLDALSKEPGLHYLPALKAGWGIWVLRDSNRLFLLTPSTDSGGKESQAAAERLASQFEGKDPTTQLRASRRAYPALILADDELWIKLEQDALGNMALSPEESEVLESVRHSDCSFPLFVNGRAGSGKSTILQYLFADMLFFHLTSDERPKGAPPIYLTANGELLRIARGTVERLLDSEAALAMLGRKGLASENRPIIDDAFREFQPFVLSLVPHDDRVRLFGRGARVDFARFRRMWMQRFGKDVKALREFGPDISWHVIRSYIKGMSSETELDPADYAQLPQNQITVTQGSFEEVFKRVWEGWYQTELKANNLWDDQDLTRYVLDHDLARALYPAVVCDEAQDFTRVELELLLRLNLFSDRSLPPADIRRVPFAFAGDPFQTLNPTGFRWDSIKASFVEKFVRELDPSWGPGRVDLNYRELQYNYRSTSQIVRFGNHVQALRAALFRARDVRPQTPWTTERHSPPVVWFRSNDASFWKKFRENPGFVVIVPCAEGEEEQFVRGDPNLRVHVRTDEEGIPVNVLSAVRAKGCEYPAVLVYGFGNAADSDVVSVALSPDETLDPVRHLPLEYFVNRVYVAVSRPKRRLVIVDTDEGVSRLWRCAQEEGVERAILDRIKNGPVMWGPEIEGMISGRPDDLTRDTVGNPLDNAKAFEADGLARQDAFMLKQAAQAYRSAGDQAKSKECRARALKAEGRWREAGEAFFDAGFVPEGVRSLWRAGRESWRRLCDKLADFPQIQEEFEYQWARVAVHSSGPDGVQGLLAKFATRLDDSDFAQTCSGDFVWSEAVSTVVRPFLDPKKTGTTAEVPWSALASSLERINHAGVRIDARLSADVHFKAGRYDKAVALWNEVGDTQSAPYQRAKVEVTPYPERIAFLANLELWNEIAEAYLAQQDAPLNNDQGKTVVNALVRTNRMIEAQGAAWKVSISSAMLDVAVEAQRRDLAPLALNSLLAGVALLVRERQWDVVSEFAESGAFNPSPDWKAKDLQAWVKSESTGLNQMLVRALARSDALPDAPNTPSRRIQDFLRRYLNVKDGKWRPGVSVLEAGAALERAGRFTDSLQFYEAVSKSDILADDAAAARERWIVCKQRHLDHERQRGSATKVNEISREIKQAVADARIANVEKLSPFPILPAIAQPIGDRTATTPDQPLFPSGSSTELGTLLTVVTKGSFKLEVSSRHRRCNITHTGSMATAYVKCADRTCGGEVSFRPTGDGVWACDDWSMVVRFPLDDGEPLVIESRDFGTILAQTL
jgi:tetratricopeptide (TPR) repeat protein